MQNQSFFVIYPRFQTGHLGFKVGFHPRPKLAEISLSPSGNQPVGADRHNYQHADRKSAGQQPDDCHPHRKRQNQPAGIVGAFDIMDGVYEHGQQKRDAEHRPPARRRAVSVDFEVEHPYAAGRQQAADNQPRR